MITSERTLKLEELIEKYDILKKDLMPVEEKLNTELSRIRLQILERARARTSFTGDPLKDLSIFKFGKAFSENYEQLLNLKALLENAAGEFVVIHDTSFNLLVNELNATDRCYVPFRVAAIGIIDSHPLETGYEHDVAGDKYYLKLRFQNGAYLRELEVKEQGKADKWLNIIPTFRGRGETYTEKAEALKLVLQTEDYKSSDDYIRQMYTGDESEKKQKKPYWRIAPDKFNVNEIKIVSDTAIEIFEAQEFPSKKYKSFALYIGNEEVTKRLKLDLNKLDTLQKIYDMLDAAKKDGWKSLIF